MQTEMLSDDAKIYKLSKNANKAGTGNQFVPFSQSEDDNSRLTKRDDRQYFAENYINRPTDDSLQGSETDDFKRSEVDKNNGTAGNGIQRTSSSKQTERRERIIRQERTANCNFEEKKRMCIWPRIDLGSIHGKPFVKHTNLQERTDSRQVPSMVKFTKQIRLHKNTDIKSRMQIDELRVHAKLEYKSDFLGIIIETDVVTSDQDDYGNEKVTIPAYNLHWNFVRLTKKNEYFIEMVSCSVKVHALSSSEPQFSKLRQHHVKEIFFEVCAGIWGPRRMFFYEYTVCVQVDDPIFSCLENRPNPDLPCCFIHLNPGQTLFPATDVLESNNYVVRIQTTQHLNQESQTNTSISSQQAVKIIDGFEQPGNIDAVYALGADLRSREGKTKRHNLDQQDKRETCFVTTKGPPDACTPGSNYRRGTISRMSRCLTQTRRGVYGQNVPSNDIATKQSYIDTGRNLSYREGQERNIAMTNGKATNVNQTERKQREGSSAPYQPVFPPTASLKDCPLVNNIHKKKPACQTSAAPDNYKGRGYQEQDEINMTFTIFQDGSPSDQFQTAVQAGSKVISGQGKHNDQSKVYGKKMTNGANSPNTCINQDEPSNLQRQEGTSCATKNPSLFPNIKVQRPKFKRPERNRICHTTKPKDVSSQIIKQQEPPNSNSHEERNDQLKCERGAIEIILISPVGQRLLRAGYRRTDIARAIQGLLQDADSAQLTVDMVLAALISLSIRPYRPPNLPFDSLMDDNDEGGRDSGK